MKILELKRCNVGEGPIWNEKNKKLYFTNAYENEICMYDFVTDKITVRHLPFNCAGIAFNSQNDLIVSHENGVHVLNEDNSLSPIYDNAKYQIKYANDMKVGPDGAIYVGTQSGKRKGVSDKIDGKLYRISKSGKVDILLDNLRLSNGMDWSIEQTKFYHTDSDTKIIKEYNFDKETGKIAFTGRQIFVEGVDGFTIGYDNNLYVACWGQESIAVVDTKELQITKHIPLPCKIPASCCFCGIDMNVLAVTTAGYFVDNTKDVKDGFTILLKMKTNGRVPFIY